MSSECLKLGDLPVESLPLDFPSLYGIAAAFKEELSSNFEIVTSEVVECPDLSRKPFNLAASGISGNTSIIDIGGPSFLLPVVQRNKIYDLRIIPELVGDEESFVIGAGAGPWPFVLVNNEMICNCVVTTDGVINAQTRVAKIVDDKPKLLTLPNTESRCCLLANLFSCRGENGNVVKVHCKKRISSLDFITCLRQALATKFPDQVIGMGGVFVILNGKAKQHVMPDFSKTPLHTEEELNNWLTFHEMSAPLTAVGTFVSKDPGLDLRVQHFHSFGKLEGGHYHYDTTPDVVEYLAFFSLGSKLYRLDRPVVAGIGFD